MTEFFYFKDNFWRNATNVTDIGPMVSKSSSLMVPRLLQEWEGFSAGESAQQMTAASRAWPGLTLLTLADIKTAAWLVENSHLTHLDSITFTTDLHTQSVSTEVETIKRVAGTVSTKPDDLIFIVKGIILTTFYYSTPDKSIFIS